MKTFSAISKEKMQEIMRASIDPNVTDAALFEMIKAARKAAN